MVSSSCYVLQVVGVEDEKVLRERAVAWYGGTLFFEAEEAMAEDK